MSYNNDNFTERKIHIYWLKYCCKQLCHQNQATDETATIQHTLTGRMILNTMYTNVTLRQKKTRQ